MPPTGTRDAKRKPEAEQPEAEQPELEAAPEAALEEPDAVEPELEAEPEAVEPEPEPEPELEAEPEDAPPLPPVNEVADALRRARNSELTARAATPAPKAVPAALAPPIAPKAAPAPKAVPAAPKAVPAPKAAPAAPKAAVVPEPEVEAVPDGEAVVPEVLPVPKAAASKATAAPTPTTFDGLMTTLDANGRDLVERHITGLKAALVTEREASKRLEKQLRTSTTIAEEAGPLRTQLAAAQGDAEASRARADFYEASVAEGVKRGNARLVYLAASDGGHIAADGIVNWPTLREKFSDLFEPTNPITPIRPTPRASVGAGLTQPATGGTRGLNQIIRDAAGRRS